VSRGRVVVHGSVKAQVLTQIMLVVILVLQHHIQHKENTILPEQVFFSRAAEQAAHSNEKNSVMRKASESSKNWCVSVAHNAERGGTAY